MGWGEGTERGKERGRNVRLLLKELRSKKRLFSVFVFFSILMHFFAVNEALH